MIYGIDYHITDVCNLNCAHCAHFCSVVPHNAKHKSIEQITSDLTLMSKFKDELRILGIMGGEPTLHPHLSRILYIARKLFPNTQISIFTNGTTADKFLQWKDAIFENNIIVHVTIYPYKEDPWENFYKIRQIIPWADSWCYPVEHGFTIYQLSNEVGEATEDQIRHCYKRWHCNQLKDGKLWICHLAAQLNRLKDAFPGQVNFDQDGQCCIDLNNDDLTIEDILKWQNETWPDICNHCLDVAYGNYGGPAEAWRTSKKELSEWVK